MSPVLYSFLFKVTMLSQNKWRICRKMLVLFLGIFLADYKSFVLFPLHASALLVPSGSRHQSTAVPPAS